MHRHGIIGTVIISCDHKKVFCSIPEFIIFLFIKFYKANFPLIVPLHFGCYTFEFLTIIRCFISCFIGFKPQPLIPYSRGNRLTLFLTILFKIISNTGNGILLFLKCYSPITIKVNPVGFIITWHKLPQTNSPGV